MEQRRPNIILINCDDLGYGDLGCYGSTVHRTPAIDRLATEGLRLTDFAMASPVCSPSRAAMLTGSLPPRIGFGDCAGRPVLVPGAPMGLAPGEETIASALRDAGYATAMVGKWHCGDQPEFLPTRHGFDSWFGLPYSNDMGRQRSPDGTENGLPPLPLMCDEEVIEEQPLMEALTERYTTESVRFLRRHREGPFFLYLAHLHPHLPHITAERFSAESRNGPYGAAVEYVNWSTEVILAELDRLGIAEDTIVIFTSDNGSRVAGEGGSNAPLRGTKRTNFEGGVRVPFLVRWPDRIPAGAVGRQLCSSMDLLPTLAAIAGTTLRNDRVRDGYDIGAIWFDPESATSPREVLPYYWMNTLEAIRKSRWKLHLVRTDRLPGEGPTDPYDVVELYDLDADIGETTNLADRHPDVVAELRADFERIRRSSGDAYTGQPGQQMRAAGTVADPRPLTTYRPDHPYLVSMYDGPSG